MKSHLLHHDRFYASLLLGFLVWAAMAWRDSPLALVLAGDAFFGGYLVLTGLLALRATPDDMRRRASYEDEGIPVIFLLTTGAISVCIAAIFLLLAQSGPRDPVRFAISLASVPLGWFTLHTLLAFRYAHLYYTCEECADGSVCEARGLQFPGTEEPGAWDFLYYSFVVGMTGQVSDVQVLTVPMRRLTLGHGVGSFFFNTVILALTVSIVASRSA